MTIELAYPFIQSRPRRIYFLFFALAGMIAANITLDYLVAQFRHTRFHISESLLFSGSFWVLFFPLLILLAELLKKRPRMTPGLLLTASVIIFHQFAYPAIVWVLSKIFYYHTFSYWQTFSFSLSAYFIKIFLIYGISFWILAKSKGAKPAYPAEPLPDSSFLTSIIVSDHYKKQALPVTEIFYISANPPYVNIHQLSRKYLYTDTLKSLAGRLNAGEFVRIHKSCIVNLSKVASFQSRQNGDYDITLSDNSRLRLSRNYARNFKERFAEKYRLTAK